MIQPDEIIARLGLEPHPKEGGFFVETYRSDDELPGAALPPRYPGARSASTAIYYLLTQGTVSAMHRLATDEIFHFYLGDPVEMLQLKPDGTGSTLLLGPRLEEGMRPQVLVPRGVWQGSRLRAGGRFALLGATVSPGFDYADFEGGERAALTAAYPAFGEMITSLTDLGRKTGME